MEQTPKAATAYPASFVFRLGARAAVRHIVDTASGTTIVALCNTITHRPPFDNEDRYMGVCRACARKADRLTRRAAKAGR